MKDTVTIIKNDVSSLFMVIIFNSDLKFHIKLKNKPERKKRLPEIAI
jgi:hypothetical protein